MKSRFFVRVIPWLIRAGVVVAFLVSVFVQHKPGSQTSSDTAVIVDYRAAMELQRSGQMNLTENLVVRMPAGKHGISRIFDTADPRRRNVDHPVSVLLVERDGRPENFSVVDTTSGTYSIRIGDAGVVLEPGEHRYRIESTTSDVFEPGDPGETLWWWDIIGSGWQMSMESVTVTATLPADPISSRCVRGDNTPCQVSVEGRTMTFRGDDLRPFEPVTVKLAFPAAALPAPIGPSSDLLGIVIGVLAALIVGALAIAAVRSTREKPVGLPAVFEPPEGIYPALGAKVLFEVDSSYALQATLFDLAERGLLALSGDDSGWDIKVVGDPAQTQMTAAESHLLAGLGLGYQDATFRLYKSEEAGKTISEAQRNLNSQVGVDAKAYLDSSPQGCVGTVLGWLSLIVFAVLVMNRWAGAAHVIWPVFIPAAVTSFILAELLFNRAAWTVRNAAGREVWSRVGGFSRFLTTDSAGSRFNFAERLDLYPRYLPWALVLGSADEWAQRYRDQGVEPPVVPWLLWTGSSSSYSMTSMTSSFDSAISSAASAYSASQSSSGGGGFSGGSGGGGGGGGTW